MNANSTSNTSEKELNQVFAQRKKIGAYKSIPINIKNKMMELFLKNPYATKISLEEISKEYQLPLIQVQNWFKYQRNRDFKNGQKIVKNYRRKHKFEKEDQLILENSFRLNRNLEENTLISLQKTLNCSEISIKRWFYYREKKLRLLKPKPQTPSECMQKPINNQELVNMQNETTMKIPTITTTQQIPNTSLTNFQINYETYNQIATQQRNKNFLQMYYSLYMNKIAWINYQNQNAQNQNMAMSILLNAANQEQAMQTILRNNYFNSL